MYDTMLAKYKAELADAKYKIDCLSNNTIIIPEHVDITKEIDELLRKISSAEDKMSAMSRHYGANKAK
tara:strand:- start:501 stop:704 length:204 start_codon:yes stop_codon:yes gene_type:complete